MNKTSTHNDLPNVSAMQFEQAVVFQKAVGRTYTDLTTRGLRLALAFSLRDPNAPLPAKKSATGPLSATRGPKGGTLKTCGKCGKKGHNARTCGKGTDKWGRRSKGKNTCGKCGKKGHNARTCGK